MMTPRAVAGPRGDALEALRPFIERFTTTTRDAPNADGTLYDGSGTSPSISTFHEGSTRVEDALPDGFRPVYAWQDSFYRYVWANLALGATVTYTEGDVSVFIPNTRQGFLDELAHAAHFYRRHDGLDWRAHGPSHSQVSVIRPNAMLTLALTYGPDHDGFWTVTWPDGTRERMPGEVLA
jgi:hypothetical protein